MAAILEVSGLKKAYKNFELKNVSFSIHEDCITGFIGVNGAGKTTTINALLNLIHRDGGIVKFRGKDISTDEKTFKDKIGVVFDSGCFYDELTIKDMTALLAPAYSEWDDHIYKQYLERFSLQQEQTIGTLSKGMKMKYALALALSHNAELLIMDEPTAGLDPKGRDEILATIKKLHEENKEMIIIFVSHSMEDVAKTAERVIVMNDGHVEMQGTVAEVFAQAEHLQKIGLNVPQVTLLTDKLRLAGYDLPEHIYTVKYAADAIKKLIGGGGNV